MCVWSAYSGSKPAAPELWESLKKIEGIWAGYYTGIVTESEGKLHMGKVLGNTRVWQEKYDLSAFPGNCGLIHSRTNSGGDERWGHPFVGSAGKVAVISQGCSGVFKDRAKAVFEKWGNEMLERGKTFSSGIYGLPERYPVLSDGAQVHSAEVGANAVEYWYEKLRDPLAAVKKVFSDINTESATCFIFADLPGVIGFANGNQRMVYQRTCDGVHLSITTIGLPNGFGMELPCNCVGLITPGELKLEKLGDRYETETFLPGGMIKAALTYIRDTPGCCLANVADFALKPLFPAGRLNYRVGSAYRVLETLLAENLVKLVPEERTGSAGAPGTVFKIYANRP